MAAGDPGQAEPQRCAPREADWYVEIVYDLPGGGDCDYAYDYFKGDRPTRAFARRALLPAGRELLECKIRACPARGNYTIESTEQGRRVRQGLYAPGAKDMAEMNARLINIANPGANAEVVPE